MKVYQSSNTPNPTPSHVRVGGKVYDKDWNEVPVKEHHGWKYIHAGGKFGVSSLPDKTGDTLPVYWDYVFGGGWERYSNVWYEKLLARS